MCICACCLSVSRVIFSPECWITGYRGQQTLRAIHHWSIQTHFLSGDIARSLSLSLSHSGKCLFTSVGNRMEVNGIKCFGPRGWSLLCNILSYYCCVQNIHRDRDGYQTLESGHIKPCGQIYGEWHIQGETDGRLEWGCKQVMWRRKDKRVGETGPVVTVVSHMAF